MFDEVSATLNEIVKRQLTPLPVPTSTESNERQFVDLNDLVTSCSKEEDCSANKSKKKCWVEKCVECHRNNQCVSDGKFRCNDRTFECEEE